jgi:hypothetical protein
MRVILPNGLSLEGDMDEIVKTSNKLGFGNPFEGVYFSSSRGPVRIKDMNTTHLRNAILKQYEAWVVSLHAIRNPRVLVNEMTQGITDKTWLTMVAEYVTREEE